MFDKSLLVIVVDYMSVTSLVHNTMCHFSGHLLSVYHSAVRSLVQITLFLYVLTQILAIYTVLAASSASVLLRIMSVLVISLSSCQTMEQTSRRCHYFRVGDCFSSPGQVCFICLQALPWHFPTLKCYAFSATAVLKLTSTLYNTVSD